MIEMKGTGVSNVPAGTKFPETATSSEVRVRLERQIKVVKDEIDGYMEVIARASRQRKNEPGINLLKLSVDQNGPALAKARALLAELEQKLHAEQQIAG